MDQLSLLRNMFMQLLQLPPTIRTASADEVPQHENILAKIEAGKTAHIVEGYVFHYNKTDDLPFTFFAEINVNNSRLWNLFKTLLLQLPEQVCVVFNFKDEDPCYSRYADKYEVLNKLESYQLEIAQDGFLEVGALFNDNTYLEEVFIRSTKYLQYWGMDEARFRQTMTKFELFEIPILNFIDQYPFVTEALYLHNPEAKATGEVIEQLRNIGDPLE